MKRFIDQITLFLRNKISVFTLFYLKMYKNSQLFICMCNFLFVPHAKMCAKCNLKKNRQIRVKELKRDVPCPNLWPHLLF